MSYNILSEQMQFIVFYKIDAILNIQLSGNPLLNPLPQSGIGKISLPGKAGKRCKGRATVKNL